MKIFYHLEKTSGRSMRQGLAASGLTVETGEGKEFQPLVKYEASGIDIYFCHFDEYFNNIHELCRWYDVYTIIRNPLDRTISHIKFLISHLNESWMKGDKSVPLLKRFNPESLNDWKQIFKEMPFLSNLQCRRLSGNFPNEPKSIPEALKMYAFEDMEKIYIELGGKLPYPKINESKQVWNIPNDCKEYILSQNIIDNELHRKLLTK